MKNKIPLQKFNKKTVAIVSISTVVVVSGGIFKLAPLLRSCIREPIQIQKPLSTPDHHLSVFKPEPKTSPIPNPSKISKLCKAVDLCKIIEGGKNYIETDEKERLVKKMHALNELNEIAGDSTVWGDFKSAQSIANCVTKDSICDCFYPLTTKYCPS